MSEENKENRINVNDLAQPEEELSPEESKEVQGGIIMANTEGDFHYKAPRPRVAAGDVTGDGTQDITG